MQQDSSAGTLHYMQLQDYVSVVPSVYITDYGTFLNDIDKIGYLTVNCKSNLLTDNKTNFNPGDSGIWVFLTTTQNQLFLQ